MQHMDRIKFLFHRIFVKRLLAAMVGCHLIGGMVYRFYAQECHICKPCFCSPNLTLCYSITAVSGKVSFYQQEVAINYTLFK